MALCVADTQKRPGGSKKEADRGATLDPGGFLILDSGPSFLSSFQFLILAP